ncbi:hypothetical protein KAS31_04770 [Candidatus Parcubacteria bacterium]|nr:hypothetical protein [Candidatus Parcubacteria bacterium]
MKQKIKQFLKLNSTKILIAIVLLFVSFYFSETTPPAKDSFYIKTQTSGWTMPPIPGGLDVSYYGSPLKSISKDCPYSCTNASSINWEIDNYFYFIFDLLFWYFTSCLIVSVYDRLKTKSKKSFAEKNL